MSDRVPDRIEGLSRRQFMRTAVVATGGAAIAIGLGAQPAAAAGKMPHAAVQYQDKPKGKQQCDNCSLWEAGGHCKLVADPIAASGWCVLYKAKG